MGHTAVRRALGIAFEGDAYPMQFMPGDVDTAWDLPRGMTFRATLPIFIRRPGDRRRTPTSRTPTTLPESLRW
jgi:hypothetical protein